MGTRHQQRVINKEGEVKISQYGQWDGFPSGQGVAILEFLLNNDLEKYQEELISIRDITQEEIDIINDTEDWQKEYPYLSRDCGSDIHDLIIQGDVLFVNKIEDEEALSWCEGFYTIDFKNNEFVSEYYDHKIVLDLSNLPTKEAYLNMFEDEE